MKNWRVSFEMVCKRNGKSKCQKGKCVRAFGIIYAEKQPTEKEALLYVKNNLYDCSSIAESHFLDTGGHKIVVTKIVSM